GGIAARMCESFHEALGYRFIDHREHDRYRRHHLLQLRHDPAGGGYNDVRRECQELGECGLEFLSAVDSPAVVNPNVGATYPSPLREPLLERREKCAAIWIVFGN